MTQVPEQRAEIERAAVQRWVLVFLVLGVGWRVVRYGLCFPFWGDESYLNINILLRDYQGLAQPLEYFQTAPLLFLWIQKTAYHLFGGGEYALRAFSLLAGLAALALFAHLAWQELEPRAAAISIGIFCVSYYLVRHTCESKAYAGELFAATALVWLGANWLRRPASSSYALVTCLAAVVLPWLSLTVIFVAGGLSLTLLVLGLTQRRGRLWGWWLVYNAVLAGSYLACFALFLAPLTTRAAGSWLEEYWQESFPPTTGIGAVLVWLLRTHTGRMLAYPVGGPTFGSSLTAVACLVGAVTLLRRPDKRLFLLLLLAPAVPNLLAAALHRYPYGGSVRVAIHFAPAICLLAGAGAGRLIECVRTVRGREIVGGAVGLLLVVLPIGGAIGDIIHPYKSPEDRNIRVAVTDFAGQLAPGQKVGIHNPLVGTHGPPDGPAFHQSLRYYLQLYAGVTPLWREDENWGPGLNWLLVYRGREFGPSGKRVAFCASQAGLMLFEEHVYPLLPGTPEALVVYRCTVAR